MPPQTNPKNSALAKLKAAENDFDAVKGNEVEVPKTAGRLPPGINEGVAQVVVAGWGVKKDGAHKDKPTLDLQALVVGLGPTDPQGAMGGRTFNGEDIFDTPEATKCKTRKDHLAKAINKIKLLCDESERDEIESANKKDVLEVITNILNKIQKEGRCFKLNTWQGKPWKGRPGRVQETWGELIPDYEVGSAVEAEVVDESGETAEEETTEETQEEETQEEETTEASGEDWAAVGEEAQAGDKVAQKKIEAKAKELKIKDEVDGAEDWNEAAQLVIDAEGGGEAQEEETPAEPWKPAVAETYKVKLKGGKTPNKPCDVEVIAVNPKKKQLNLREVATKKIFKDLAYDEDAKTIAGNEVS